MNPSAPGDQRNGSGGTEKTGTLPERIPPDHRPGAHSLGYSQKKSLADLAQEAGISRLAVNKVINKALAVGVITALDDLPRTGRPSRISPESKLWVLVLELACRKPTDLRYPHENWTVDLLARHVRAKAPEAGYPSLQQAGKSLIHKILFEQEMKPHRIRYYLEKRDPDFERKKALVLSVYQDVALRQTNPEERGGTPVVTVSLDEKPGVQAQGLSSVNRKKMSCFQDLTCPFFQKEFIPPGFHDRFKSLGSSSSVVYQETSSSVFSS